MSREVLSALRITHVLKHNDAIGKRVYDIVCIYIAYIKDAE